MYRYRECVYSKLMIFLLFLCLDSFFSSESYKIRSVPEDVVPDLYLKYKEAINDKANISSRRLFINDKQYEIHVKRLKDVNGFKVHNLMIKENLRTDSDPLIYINNPVESKIPKAYLSLEEFKNVLTNRVIKQRNELTTKDKIKLFTRKPEKADIKGNINVTKLNNNKKSIKVIDTSIANLRTEIVSVQDTTATRSFVTKLVSQTTEPIVTKGHTESKINLIPKYKEESIHNNKKELVESNSDNNKSSDLETTAKLEVTYKITDKNEDKAELGIEKQLTKTTLDNNSKNVLETTVMDNVTSLTNKKMQELNKEVNNNEEKVLNTTDSETLREENVNTVQSTTLKEKPRRKTTIKLSQVSKTTKKSQKSEKRSTLGRPLVFMGSR